MSYLSVSVDVGARRERLFLNRLGGRCWVSRTIAKGGWKSYDRPLPLIIFKHFASTGGVLYNIGVGSGYFAVLAAVAGAAHVAAFEPSAEAIGVLADNLAMNELRSRVSSYQIALSDRTGHSQFYFPDDSHGLLETSASLNSDFRNRHSKVVDVETMRLDDFVRRHSQEPSPDLMLIDVEGHEREVLAGAEETLRDKQPALIIEILDQARAEDVLRTLSSLGYRYVRFVGNALRATTEIVADKANSNHLFIHADRFDAFIKTLTG